MSNLEKSYRASFYNDLVSSSGKVCHPCQRTFDMQSAQPKSDVIEEAKKLFAAKEAVSSWELRAQRVELIEITR